MYFEDISGKIGLDQIFLSRKEGMWGGSVPSGLDTRGPPAEFCVRCGCGVVCTEGRVAAGRICNRTAASPGRDPGRSGPETTDSQGHPLHFYQSTNGESMVRRSLAFGLKLSVGRMCSCCARGVPHGWYNLKHSLQKLALQSAQPLVASSVWGGLQNWHITATLPRLTVCRYL